MQVMYFGIKRLLWSSNMEGKIKPRLKKRYANVGCCDELEQMFENIAECVYSF